MFELGRRLEGRIFEYLLTRFTEPNELFGPFDIRKREGELLTNTEGMLLERSSCSSTSCSTPIAAILNSLLMVLNERIFRRGCEKQRFADADGDRGQQPATGGRRAKRCSIAFSCASRATTSRPTGSATCCTRGGNWTRGCTIAGGREYR